MVALVGNVLTWTRTALVGLAVAVSLSSGAQTPAPAKEMDTISPVPLSLADARHMADAALESCKRRGHPTAAFVLDSEGQLRVALSDDHAGSVGLRTAPRKAAAVLAFRVSSKDLEARVLSDKQFAARYGNDDRYVFHDGAVPIYRHGVFVGVLALGGAHGFDELCAQDGLKALPGATSIK
jgi:glc operon protein GlcG